MTPIVRWIEELGEGDVSAAGAKLARMGELRAAGLKVPEGFVVTTTAYRQFLHHPELATILERHLAAIGDPDDFAALDAAATAIRRAFEAFPLPEDVAPQIVDAYEELSDRCRDLNVPTAVRSSATGEDAAAASFAGQFDTYLGVAGPERVLEAVRRCWGSAFTARALAYRARQGLDHRDSPMAVGVVELVHARASGVAFSVHPVTGKTDRMVIECSWGWGEAVVQGLVTPDHVEVGKTDRRVLEYRVARKEMVSMFDYARGRVVEGPMPPRLRERRVLADEEVAAVGDAVLRIEAHYGYPVDVEWVLSRHRRPGEPVAVVQARPETVQTRTTAVPPGRTVVGVADLARAYLLGERDGSRRSDP